MDEAQTAPAADWSVRVSTSGQGSPACPGNPWDHLLRSMDPEVTKSFTEEQLRELERAFTKPASSGTPINIRLTVPFFRRQFYLTFLAGPEQRSAARLKQERVRHAIWTFWNICSFVFLLVLFIPTLIGLIHIVAFAG